MAYGVLVVPWEQIFLGEPLVVYGFVGEYPLAYVGCVAFGNFVFIFVGVGAVVYYRVIWVLYVVVLYIRGWLRVFRRWRCG